jgi:hypothetical protein
MEWMIQLAVILTLLLPGTLYGQEDTNSLYLPLIKNKYGYFERNQRISREVFWAKIASEPEAAKYMMRGQRQRVVSAVFGAGGLVILATPVKRAPAENVVQAFVAEVGRDVSRLGKVVIGGSMVTGGIVLFISSLNNSQKAIDTYNDRLLTNTNIKLGVTANGVGLLVEF